MFCEVVENCEILTSLVHLYWQSTDSSHSLRTLLTKCVQIPTFTTNFGFYDGNFMKILTWYSHKNSSHLSQNSPGSVHKPISHLISLNL